VLAGLIVITPGSGFVAPWSAIVIGVIGGTLCNFSTRLKHILKFDDALDAWGFHGFGGFLGNILCGIFAQKWVANLDGTVIRGGWMDGHWVQVGYQLAASVVSASYAFVVSFIILYAINLIPGCALRASNESEMIGQDETDMGEMMHAFLDEKEGEKLVKKEGIPLLPLRTVVAVSSDGRVSPM
jgi:Amt family ammonium transporter